MGIDKANVRTVLHTALPASVEAFYQEIGRAGRDGLPSRSVLLHSYADRKLHEFFLERDYPPASDLARVAQLLTEEFLMPEPLAQRLKMDLDTFNKSIEKLIAQGAASIDLVGNVRRAGPISTKESWRAGYEAQIAFRRAQLDRMVAFAETQQCRMTAIIRHFGDTADARRPCGQCDFCSPSTTSVLAFAPPTTAQARDLRTILASLAHRSTSTGKLHTDLAPNLDTVADRRAFEVLLDALARAGLITLTAETFTNAEGNVLPYKKAALTHEGRSDDASELTGVVLPAASDEPLSPSTLKRKRARAASRCPEALASGLSTRQKKGALAPGSGFPTLTPAQEQLDDALRAWRKSEAAKTGKPAFIVLSDAVIRNLAIAQPRNISELLTVPGIGPSKADKFGPDIIAICRGATTTPAATPGSPTLSSSRPERSEVERPPHFAQVAANPSATRKAASRYPKASALNLSDDDNDGASAPGASSLSTPTFHRTRPAASDPTASLTPDQLLLDTQLRAWRKAESARIGLPQFFVLGSSTLRSIVLLRPKTIAQLQTISGIGPDMAEKFGASIVELCRA